MVLTAFVPVDVDMEPRLFIRLVEVDGLDQCACPAEAPSPLLRLAVGVDGVLEHRSGPYHRGGNDDMMMLRVSYHGDILTWGRVLQFYVVGRSGRAPPRRAWWPRRRGSVLQWSCG
jgi:hypothetical protein